MQKHIVLFILLILVSVHETRAEDPFPPEQPSTGPGGYNYEHEEVTVSGPYWAPISRESNKYFFFMPAEPIPEKAPVILFLHGFAAVFTEYYVKWIGHIVKKGYIVVWLQYQHNNIIENSILTLPSQYSNKIIGIWKDALSRLDSEGSDISPEKDETGMIKTAIVGHSAGGLLSAVVAAKAAKKLKRMPVPYAVVAVEPGGLHIIPRRRFNKMDPDTKLIIVVGDEDNVVCKKTAVKLWNMNLHIPDENKDFLMAQSDYHGDPEQIANHYFPGTTGARDTADVDARDFYVTFKLTVGALNCALKGTDCEYALGNGADEQVYMGEWSDGETVEPMVWVENPNSLETTCEDSTYPINLDAGGNCDEPNFRDLE